MAKKNRRQEKQLKEQLGIKVERGDTFVGFRPCYFADKSKYNRQQSKLATLKRIKEEV